jgi:hypothetical protein
MKGKQAIMRVILLAQVRIILTSFTVIAVSEATRQSDASEVRSAPDRRLACNKNSAVRHGGAKPGACPGDPSWHGIGGDGRAKPGHDGVPP